jgi:hypothetical protein
VLTLRGFLPGLFTIMEAMLIVEPCGKIYAAILDEGHFCISATTKSISIGYLLQLNSGEAA